MDILRTNGQGGDKATIVHVSDDGKKLSHHSQRDIIDFPSGGAKFTIRYDRKTNLYWSIPNKETTPQAYRNILVLTSSPNLREWKIEKTLLRHTDSKKHAWQYVDWLFEGDDIIAHLKNSLGGAYNAHDTNYLTFHRIGNFRKKNGEDLGTNK